MTYLEKEVDRLESLVRDLSNRIWDLEKVERKYLELLHKTGVANHNSQERGINEMADTVMGLPYLEATTMLGRAGELKRLSKKLASYSNKEVGYSVPEHLRPANFSRSLANRREVEELWEEIQDKAKVLMESDTLRESDWEKASGPKGFCDIDRLALFLKRIPEVAFFEESLREAYSECVDGLIVPESFVQLALQEIREQTERFMWGTSEVPTDWSLHLTNILGKGFIPKMSPWEAKGLSFEEWRNIGELVVVLPDKGYESDIWYTAYWRSREEVLEGNFSNYQRVLMKSLENLEFTTNGVLLEKGGKGSIIANKVLLSSYLEGLGGLESRVQEPLPIS